MSIADDVRAPGAYDSRASGQGERYGEAPFDRSPPQDIAAEQCVLGGMMLSKDAIADVLEILRSQDFYRPAHATVFDVVLDLYGRGEPADPITVAAALHDAGDLVRVGGAAYLHTLISSVPTAANSAYYARIVAERAVLRRLVEAGTRIVQLGYGSAAGQGRDVDDIVDLAQQVVYDVMQRRVSDDFAVLADLLQPALDEIEAVGSRDGVMAGVPTGFGDLDRLLNGLHPGQLIIVAGRPGLGKALALDTPLPTPDGWTTMGQVAVGDRLFGADGRPTTVIAASEVMVGRSCYEVELSDGSTLVADAEHLWAVTRDDQASAGPSDCHTDPDTDTATTEQLAMALRTRSAHRRLGYAVTNARPLDLPDRPDLPLAAYAFGVWLGTGAGSGGLPPAVEAFRALGVLDDKHIPVRYLRASEPQRRELLAGLLDAGAAVAPGGQLHCPVTSRRLARDVLELLVSLGYHGTVTTSTGDVWQAGTSTVDNAGPATVVFTTADDVFWLERKRLAHKERRGPAAGAGAASRSIMDVRVASSVPVRCVTVDNADHLYLAGRSMVPTHNSTVSMDFARNAAVRHNQTSAIFSLEMSKIEIVTRLLSAEARVPLHVLRSGQLSDDDWTRLARRMGEISEAPIFVDDTPNMTLMEIRAKARRMRQRHDLKLVVVDYLQLMTSPKRVENRQQEVAELSRGLKLLAKEIECPVIAVSQLNRGPEQRTDKRPQLSDLRESGCLVASTRLVRADTNQEVSLGELVRAKATGIPVWALDESLRYVPRTLTHAFPSGRRPTVRMHLASGRQIQATRNHRFLTVQGWTPLWQLEVGTRIAVARHLPAPLQLEPMPPDRLADLARRVRPDSPAQRLPRGVCQLPKHQLSALLRHLWTAADVETMGSFGTGPGGGRVRFVSASRRLVEQVSMLLLRWGVSSRMGTAAAPPRRPSRLEDTGPPTPLWYELEVCEPDDRLRFLRGVGGARGSTATAGGVEVVDRLTSGVWSRVRDILVESVDVGRPAQPDAAPAAPLARMTLALAEADLDLHATNDVLWDEVVALEPAGDQDVYDATVLGLHNFVANGVATHNSIEQDADVVILLHRDDYYDKESPRAGEADFIVAKHRNGPTDTVTVAAQLHYSRFVDMAVT